MRRRLGVLLHRTLETALLGHRQPMAHSGCSRTPGPTNRRAHCTKITPTSPPAARSHLITSPLVSCPVGRHRRCGTYRHSSDSPAILRPGSPFRPRATANCLRRARKRRSKPRSRWLGVLNTLTHRPACVAACLSLVVQLISLAPHAGAAVPQLGGANVEGPQRVESSQYATRYLDATALDGATGERGGGVFPFRRIRRSSDGPHFAQSHELKSGSDCP
jgi:hypothetical protein